MGEVTKVVITCAGIEDGEDDLGGGLPALREWCARQPGPFRLQSLDLSDASSGKSIEGDIVLAAGLNGRHAADDLVEAWMTFPWLFPVAAVLIVQREDQAAEIVRGDGSRVDAAPAGTMAEGAVEWREWGLRWPDGQVDPVVPSRERIEHISRRDATGHQIVSRSVTRGPWIVLDAALAGATAAEDGPCTCGLHGMPHLRGTGQCIYPRTTGEGESGA